jgi:CRP/FNR family transcriptional regulator, cyclic AMP receptor protein
VIATLTARRRALDPKIERMRRVPLFADCSDRELAAIAPYADEVSVPAGSKLMRRGRLGHEFVVLLEGEAIVERDGLTIRTLEAGDFAGEISLLTGHGRTADVTTTTPAKLLVFGESGFARALERAPGLTLHLIHGLGRHVGPYMAA